MTVTRRLITGKEKLRGRATFVLADTKRIEISTSLYSFDYGHGGQAGPSVSRP